MVCNFQNEIVKETHTEVEYKHSEYAFFLLRIIKDSLDSI